MQDVEIIEINDEQAYNAKLLASGLSAPHIRKRGMIDILGINCAINYLYSKKIKVSTQRSVYKIPALFEEFKISDIYFGNYRIDVITLYKEKNIKIPKIHVDMDIMPHFYFVVQIGSKIKEAKMIGFIEAKSILACSHDSKYYYPTLNLIFNTSRFQELTRRSISTKTMLGKHVDCMGLFLKFIDNDLSSLYKRQLIQHLMNCDACRSRFIDTCEFEKLANNIRFYPDLIRKTETISTIPAVQFENSNNGKFASFEENIKKVEIREVQNNLGKEDFIEIPKVEIKDEDKEIKPQTVEMFDLYADNDKKQFNKNVIDNIFKDIPKMEFNSFRQVIGARNRRIVFVTILIIFVLAGFALISINNSSDTISKENDEINLMEEFNNNSDEDYQDDFNIPQNLSQNNQNAINPMDAYVLKQPQQQKASYTPTISKISWEAPESLIKKENYTNFLKSIGKNVKLNLQNDLLLINDTPLSKVVKVDIAITGAGEVESINISTSSGSRLIDDTILRVLSDTLKYMKPPSNGLLARTSVVTLILDIN